MQRRSTAATAQLTPALQAGPLFSLLAWLILLAAIFPIAVFGDDDWYQVEVVAFDQMGGAGEDRRQRALQLSYPGNWQQLIDPDATIQQRPDYDGASQTLDEAVESLGEPEEQPFLLLPSSERRLNGDVNRLERSGAYRVLFHEAWRQTMGNRARAPWILIRGGDSFGEHQELEGALRLYLQRALFVQANVWRSHFQPYSGENPDAIEQPVVPPWPARYGGETPLFETLAREAAQAAEESSQDWFAFDSPAAVATVSDYVITRVAALEQTQRLELGETLYLDHPDLGLLVHITRYQRDTDEDEDLDSE